MSILVLGVAAVAVLGLLLLGLAGVLLLVFGRKREE